MIDLAKVRNYYIACGYTDLRLGIDGLAAVVTQQYGSHLDEESLFLFCAGRVLLQSRIMKKHHHVLRFAKYKTTALSGVFYNVFHEDFLP